MSKKIDSSTLEKPMLPTEEIVAELKQAMIDDLELRAAISTFAAVLLAEPNWPLSERDREHYRNLAEVTLFAQLDRAMEGFYRRLAKQGEFCDREVEIVLAEHPEWNDAEFQAEREKYRADLAEQDAGARRDLTEIKDLALATFDEKIFAGEDQIQAAVNVLKLSEVAKSLRILADPFIIARHGEVSFHLAVTQAVERRREQRTAEALSSLLDVLGVSKGKVEDVPTGDHL